MVRLAIRKGQTLKTHFKLKKQNYSKNHSKWIDVPDISSFGAQIKGANNQVLTPGKCHQRHPNILRTTIHILHQTSYHLLGQVPSCATHRENREVRESKRWGNPNSTLPFLFSPSGQSPKGGMEGTQIQGAVTEMSLYQNCNSVRNTNLQISDEQWFLEGKNERLTCAVVGLALRGIQAVLDKCFCCLWTVCRVYHFPA